MALFKRGDTVWVNPERWEEATVVAVETVPGPLGTPTVAYTVRTVDGERTHYEMTLRNFQWLWSQASKEEPSP